MKELFVSEWQTFYHITSIENAKKIFNEGLKPHLCETFEETLNEKRPFSYLSSSITAVVEIWEKYEEMGLRSGQYAILEVSFSPKVRRWVDEDCDKYLDAIIIDSEVSPDNIKVVDIRWEEVDEYEGETWEEKFSHY